MNRIDPTYLKAYYRRGSANYALGKLKEALKDFKQVVKVKPKDEDAVKKMKTCEKEIKAEAFIKAIESEGGPVGATLLSQQDLEGMIVEAAYTGPRLGPKVDDSEPASEKSSGEVDLDSNQFRSSHITMNFVHELIAHFKVQKLLHRK
jgi:tetratricopeptide (TPR) repeat protein